MAHDTLLKPPNGEQPETVNRHPSAYNPLDKFKLAHGEGKHYQQQYGQMYFVRLAMLKPAVEAIATEAWEDFALGSEKVQHVDRVLDVRQGELCWIAGTIYLDMPLKPNILDDISKDYWISAPPAREKFVSEDGQDQTMLEDESGRLRLIGTPLQTSMLVTGCIVAVIGTENSNGEFEIIDMRVPDLPRQPQRWERDDSDYAMTNGKSTKRKQANDREDIAGGKIAILSGLNISGDSGDILKLDLLAEYLTGEICDEDEQAEVGKISRLIVTGNSIASASLQDAKDELLGKKAGKKFGYDASSYNPIPTAFLDQFLASLLPTMPITLIPGESDPANTSMPQQPIHPAMLPHARAYSALPEAEDPGWFHSVTNPWEGDIDGWRFLGTGGQPIDDIFKYVHGDDRLEMMEHLLRWRNGAPTAPDTLWCYPFQGKDPFIIQDTPHVYFVGNQPRFETTVIQGPAGQAVRLICVPKFSETGEIVLVDSDTLNAEVVKIALFEDT